jgi:hypothetical protein
MPFQVFRGGNAAALVYGRGIGLNGQRRYDVGMGGFAVANNVNNATALGTSGAGPCQIIVVHKAAGHGALGHYAADPDPTKIVQGVNDMVQQLGGGPIAGVVFGAGQVGDGRAQLNYELVIVAQVRSMCQGASVIWPTAPVDDVWGCCYYLPLAEEIGFLDMSPGGFAGMGNATNGITIHSY